MAGAVVVHATTRHHGERGAERRAREGEEGGVKGCIACVEASCLDLGEFRQRDTYGKDAMTKYEIGNQILVSY